MLNKWHIKSWEWRTIFLGSAPLAQSGFLGCTSLMMNSVLASLMPVRGLAAPKLGFKDEYKSIKWEKEEHSCDIEVTYIILKSSLSHDQCYFAWRLERLELCRSPTPGGGGFGKTRLHSAVSGRIRQSSVRDCVTWLPYLEIDLRKKTQRTVNSASPLQSHISLNLLWLFGLNGTDKVLEGHNIPRTSYRRTSKCEYYCEMCVFVAELTDAYARMRVLSTQGAMAVGRLSREFVIEFWLKYPWITHV